ncbi:cytochrome P450 1A5-like [Patiria miniata]|uniref:unspecific monooxygenase n=1 Tax=Patiria miniata TaxID=46514 RepID=A0A914B155_PATMI|nr:cytochrome P450 1A5-like [Patiria miniata]
MLIATGQAVMAHLMPEGPSTVTWATIVLSIFLIILITEEIRRFLVSSSREHGSSSKGLKVLPGPWGLPLLGNILQLGTAPHVTLKEMARKYGDVFQIRIGSRPVVVLNGYQAIRQALVKQSIDFAGRPDLSSTRSIQDIFGSTLAFSTHGEGWKLQRKITHSTLRHFTSGSQLSSVGARISREALDLIEAWTSQPEKNNSVSEGVQSKRHPFNILKLSVSNVMYSYIFGRRHTLDDQKLLDFIDMSDAFSEAIGTGNPADFMPWLRHFSGRIHDRFVRMLREYKDWFGKDIADHIHKYEEDSEANILDYLITVCRRTDQEKMERLGLSEEIITSSVHDMFGAGFDTMSAALKWAVALMIIHPDVQRELQAEIDAVIGRDRYPATSDRGRLPLTESCLLEVFRYSSMIPMTIPHSTTKDTELNGYFIPKDTVVFVNLHSMHHDENRWEKPEEFNPRRFLTEDGSRLDPAKTVDVMPFGAGKRRCIGSELARLEFFLYFTTLMHQCNLAAADGVTPKMQHSPGLVQTPLPFSMTVRKRDENREP